MSHNPFRRFGLEPYDGDSGVHNFFIKSVHKGHIMAATINRQPTLRLMINPAHTMSLQAFADLTEVYKVGQTGTCLIAINPRNRLPIALEATFNDV